MIHISANRAQTGPKIGQDLRVSVFARAGRSSGGPHLFLARPPFVPVALKPAKYENHSNPSKSGPEPAHICFSECNSNPDPPPDPQGWAEGQEKHKTQCEIQKGTLFGRNQLRWAPGWYCVARIALSYNKTDCQRATPQAKHCRYERVRNISKRSSFHNS